jgi:hypothetical protein
MATESPEAFRALLVSRDEAKRQSAAFVDPHLTGAFPERIVRREREGAAR